jgi:hypothetical protein
MIIIFFISDDIKWLRHQQNGCPVVPSRLAILSKRTCLVPSPRSRATSCATLGLRGCVVSYHWYGIDIVGDKHNGFS